jgi:hypothetical protein
MHLLSTTSLVFRVHLARVLRSRRALICLLLAAVPPLILYLGQRFGPSRAGSEKTVAVVAWWLSLQVVTPLLSLVAGSAVITEEIESRTISYVFTRPVSRAALLYGRWLATLVLVCGLLGASAWGVGRLAQDARPDSMSSEPTASQQEPEQAGRRERHRRQGDDDLFQREEKYREARAAYVTEYDASERQDHAQAMIVRFLQATLLGGAVYSLLFAVLGVFLRHPMIVGLGYCFAFEVLLANLPGSTQSLSIQYWLRGILVDPRMPIFRKLYLWDVEKLPDIAASLPTLAWLLVVGLVLGGLAIRRRQYELTA